MRVEFNTNTEIKNFNNQSKEQQICYKTSVIQDQVCFSGNLHKSTEGFLGKLKKIVSEFGTKISEETKKPTQKVEQSTTKIIKKTKLPFSRKNVNISIAKNTDGELFNFSTNTKDVRDYRLYCQDGATKIFYEKSADVTAIHVPYGGKSLTIQVDGLLTKDEANNLIKYLNLQGFPDERYFLDGTVEYLNTRPIVKYSEKNIGMEYDFHDRGSDIYFPAQKWTCDTRLFYKQVNAERPSVKCIYTNDDKNKLTTIISRFIPNSQSRFGADWYSLFIDGIITEKQATELIEHIETSISKRNIVPEKSDLQNILQVTIDFLNK